VSTTRLLKGKEVNIII